MRGRVGLIVALVLSLIATAACTSSRSAPAPSSTSTPPSTSSRASAPSLPSSSQSSSSSSSSSTSASQSPTSLPVRAGSDYLALGDSVSFGYREPTTRPAPDYAHAASFVGYPELVARSLHLHVANAACPGETSVSLIDQHGASFGCERGANGNRSAGYRTHYPLHEHYSGSQLSYAVTYLRAHAGTRLVTLMIGANDAFRCGATTSDRCTSEVSSLLARVRRNVATIVHALRGRAHYTGQLVLVTYYAAQYGGLQAVASTALNSALIAGARGYHVRIADGFGAFERAAKRFGGDSCRAGLLTRLATGHCGVHPSAAGQRLLAGAVERAIRS